jgi:hypothetical protein
MSPPAYFPPLPGFCLLQQNTPEVVEDDMVFADNLGSLHTTDARSIFL